MEVFSAIEAILLEHILARKFGLIEELHTELQHPHDIHFAHAQTAIDNNTPSYAHICKIVHGSEVERRRNLGTREGRGVFLHALAHIEYSAIDLAFDSAYRFRNLPPQYYEDFLTVAFDEARHFAMLRDLLNEIDYDYGSFSVHTGIYDAMVRSQSSVRQRMAATHRHLEAGGLDAHPELARKFAAYTDPFAVKISKALQIIYDDEIRHVWCGDFWFRYACGAQNLNAEVYAQDVTGAIPGVKLVKKNLNSEARLRAGFTKLELAALQG